MSRDGRYDAKSQEGDAATSRDWTVCRKEPGMAAWRKSMEGRYNAKSQDGDMFMSVLFYQPACIDRKSVV